MTALKEELKGASGYDESWAVQSYLSLRQFPKRRPDENRRSALTRTSRLPNDFVFVVKRRQKFTYDSIVAVERLILVRHS